MNLIYDIGLDVHNDSIAISIEPSDHSEASRQGIIRGTHDAASMTFQLTPPA